MINSMICCYRRRIPRLLITALTIGAMAVVLSSGIAKAAYALKIQNGAPAAVSDGEPPVGEPAAGASAVTATARIEGDAVLESKVGFPQRVLQIVYPGGELEVRDVDPRTTPVVLRIDASYAHGSDFRYDLTWTGMEPGEFNLTEYLRRKDGTDSSGLPSCVVKVQSVLPASGFDLKLEGPATESRSAPYRTAWLVGAIVWTGGLIALIAVGRRRKSSKLAATPEEIAKAKLTRIEELINAAMQSDKFTTEQKAVLDRLILDFWRERRMLTSETAESSLRILRQDAEAGPLLQQIERWLYDRPEKTSQEEIVRVLSPLRAIVLQAAGESVARAGGPA